MTGDEDTSTSSLEAFLDGSGIDPEMLGEPPLRNGEDPLLSRDRVEFKPGDE